MVFKLNRTGSVLNRHERLNFNENWDNLEKIIRDRGLEILSESGFLTWLEKNGIKHREEVATFDDLPSNDSLNTVRGVVDDNKIYIKKESGWVPFQTIDISKINNVESKVEDIAINIKNFGARGDGETDDTLAIQNALDMVKPGGTVIIPEGVYMVDGVGNDNWNHTLGGGLIIKKPMNLIIDSGAVIKQIPTDSTGYALITVYQTHDVKISGGVIDGDKESHLGVDGEFGVCVSVYESKDVILENLKCINGWGDGVYIWTRNQPDYLCENITISNVHCDNNRRNGLTVKSAKHVMINRSIFSNQTGTDPRAGIDIEPDGIADVADNIIIDQCDFYGNGMQDVVFGGGVGCKNIKIINSNFVSEGTTMNILSGTDTALISNCFIKTHHNGIGIFNTKNVSLNNTIIKSLNTEEVKIAILTSSEKGVSIEGCLIEDFGIAIDITNTVNHLSVSNSTFKNIRSDFFRTLSNKCNFAKIVNNKMINVNTNYGSYINDSVFDGNDYIQSNLRGRLLRCVIKNNSFRDFNKTAITGVTLDATIITSNSFETDEPGIYAVINFERNDPHEQNIIYSNISRNITPTFIVSETDLVQDNITI